MPIQMELPDHEFAVIRATGTLTKADFEGFSDEFERLVRERGKLRILFDATQFDGWSSTGIWEELKFDVEHNHDISRLAFVGDKKWQETFVKALKPFAFGATRYFEESEMAEAQEWLSA